MYFRVKKKKNGKKREHIVDVLYVYVWKKTAKEIKRKRSVGNRKRDLPRSFYPTKRTERGRRHAVRLLVVDHRIVCRLVHHAFKNGRFVESLVGYFDNVSKKRKCHHKICKKKKKLAGASNK